MGDERCVCGHPRHKAECYDCIRYDLRTVCIDYRPAPSPARGDAEKVVLTPEELALSAPIGIEGIPLAFYQKDVERIISARLAAHMATPDELTALRAENAELRRIGLPDGDQYLYERLQEVRAERDALRERVAELERDCADLKELAEASGMVESRAIVRAVARERERDALRERIRALLDYLEKYALAEEDDRKAAFTSDQAAYWEGRRDSTKEASGQVRELLGDA